MWRYCAYCGESIGDDNHFYGRTSDEGLDQCKRCRRKEKEKIEREGIGSRFDILDL
jgi:hypothetical protein